MKECTKCHEAKELEEFSRNKRGRDGLYSQCKTCVNEAAALYRSENRDKLREGSARYRAKNPGKDQENSARWYAENTVRAREIAARWRAENPGKRRETTARYYAKNKEKMLDENVRWRAENADRCREVNARWRAENPHIRAQHHVLRRTRFRQACVPWADQEAIAAIYRLRKKLTEESGIKHEVDHVIPLRSNLVCGLHVHNNLRVITAAENRKKKNRFSCE